MNLTETQDQRALRDQARGFLERRYPISRVAALADGDGFPRQGWEEIAELGWTAIGVSEGSGGAGLGFAEEAVLAEELGRALFPGPFLATVILALPALAADLELQKEVAFGRAPATLAWAGPDGAFETDRFPVGVGRGARRHHLYGSTWFVPDLALAEIAVVAGEGSQGPGVWGVRLGGDGVSRRDLPTIDATRRLGALFLEGAEGTLLAEGEAAVELLDRIRDRVLAALAMEAVGVASTALEMAVQHARTRAQFGRPIGAFQAVSQQLAEAYVEVESARSLSLWAAAEVASGHGDRYRVAAAAKAFATEAAVRTCERAIQVHGGMGFTWEHPLHRFYRRAEWILAFMDRPTGLRERVAASLLDPAEVSEGDG
ncbi:MAG TPA: acyl-CoA dehydrogenase family protein [Actinomycetota bacterium]